MAIPQLPIVLTEADWKKNKPATAKVGADPIGKQLNIVGSGYRGVHWQSFDVDKALVGEKMTARHIQKALDNAKDEYERTVELLLGRLKMLHDEIKKQNDKSKSDHLKKMLAAIPPFTTQIKAIEASYAEFEKARDEAKAKEPPGGLDDDDDELDLVSGLTDGNDKVLIKSLIGPKFYALLDQMTFYRDQDVLAWTDLPELSINQRTKAPDDSLHDIQMRGKAFIALFAKAVDALRLVGNRTMPKAAGLRAFQQAWAAARQGFSGPGIYGVYRGLMDQQVKVSGGQQFLDAWRQGSSSSAMLNRKVERLLDADRGLMEAMSAEVGRLRVKGVANPKLDVTGGKQI